MKKYKNLIFNISVILIFFLLSLWIASFHEPWADEAHAWLFAKDVSVVQLVTKHLHSEGHPILWFLILKIFILFKLPYEKIYFVSVLFSTLGVSLFLWKSGFNKLIKILFTFSYFILYQYTVIARGYCLILPLFCFLAIFWKDRHKKIYLFTLFIILLLSTEVHTFLTAGTIYFLLLCEFFKNKYENKRDHIICFIILFLMFLFTTIYCFPLSTSTTATGLFVTDFYYVSYSFFYPFVKLSTSKFYEIGAFIMSMIIFFVFYKIYKNDKEKAIQFIMFMILPIIFLTFKYCSGWHLGIITLITIFCFWIHGYQDNSLVTKFLIFTFICQIPWTVVSVYNDIKKPYYKSIEVANFIKTYDYQNMKIYGSNYFTTSLIPYFDKNIYYNMDDKGGFYWDSRSLYYNIINSASDDGYNFIMNSMDNGEFDISMSSCYSFNLTKDFYLKNNIDIIVQVCDEIPESKYYEELLEYYNVYRFDSNMYFELTEYQRNNFFIFVKKDVDWRSNDNEILVDNKNVS